MKLEPPAVDVDEVMMTENGAVVFITVTWRGGFWQRGSLTFIKPDEPERTDP